MKDTVQSFTSVPHILGAHEPTTCRWSHYSIEGEPLKLNQVEQRPSELRNKMRRTDGLSGRTHITHNSHCYCTLMRMEGGRVGK